MGGRGSAALGTRPPSRSSAAPTTLHPLLIALVALAGGLVIGAAAMLGPAVAGGALAVSLAGVYLLRRPVLAAVILAGAVPALSGLKRGLPVPGLRLTEILIGALAVAILITVKRGHAAKWGTFDWLALLYGSATALLGGIALLSRGESLSGENLGVLLGPFQFLLVYRAVRSTIRTEEHRILALRLVLLAAVPVCLLTFLQVANVAGIRDLLLFLTSEPDTEDLFAEAAADGVGRATGPFVIWHTLSAYLWLISLLAFALAVRGERRVLPLWALWAVVVMSSAAILLTISATPVIALVAGVLWLAYRHRRLGRTVLLLTVAAVIGAVALAPSIAARSEQQQVQPSTGANPLIPQTLAFRYDVWTEQYLPVIFANPLTGYGPGLPPGVTWESTESIYITMLLRGGLPLLLIYLALTVTLVARARGASRAREAPIGATVGEVVAVGVVILYAYQAVVPLFNITGMPHLLWALAGLMPRVVRRDVTAVGAGPAPDDGNRGPRSGRPVSGLAAA